MEMEPEHVIHLQAVTILKNLLRNGTDNDDLCDDALIAIESCACAMTMLMDMLEALKPLEFTKKRRSHVIAEMKKRMEKGICKVFIKTENLNPIQDMIEKIKRGENVADID